MKVTAVSVKGVRSVECVLPQQAVAWSFEPLSTIRLSLMFKLTAEKVQVLCAHGGIYELMQWGKGIEVEARRVQVSQLQLGNT